MGSDYNKHESKYFNTARLMNQALLKLLEVKDYDYITVSEVCKKAGVNRSTFYLHYEGMDDLLVEALEYSNQAFFSMFSRNIPDVLHDDKKDLIFINPEFLVPYLSYIKENRRLFLASKHNPNLFGIDKTSNLIIENTIYPILERFHVPTEEKKYAAAFFISGVQGIVMEWVKTECKDEIDDMVRLIMDYIVQPNIKDEID